MMASHRVISDIQEAEISDSYSVGRMIRATITYTSGAVIVGKAPANARVAKVAVKPDTAFDGTLTISVGDSDDDDRLMTTAQNVPTSTAVSTTTPYYKYTTPTDIICTVTPGTATAGSGQVTVYFE